MIRCRTLRTADTHLTPMRQPPKGGLMFLIAIDPGAHTGLVMFDHDDKVVVSVTEEAPYEFILGTLDAFSSAHVVAERSPESGHQLETTKWIEHEITERVDGSLLTWVRPSEWKGHPNGEPGDGDVHMLKSGHEKDACSIGRWYLATRSDRAPA